MIDKQARSARKIYRETVEKYSKGKYARYIFRLARNRDILGIILIIENIILFILFLIFILPLIK